MSDKAILHRNGIVVIEKTNHSGGNGADGDVDGEEIVEPIAPILSDLELQIEELKEEIENEKSKKDSNKDKDLIKENKIRIKEIELEIKDILNLVAVVDGDRT